MCTALSLKAGDHFFGRNLDLDCSYGERVCIMPRNFPLSFRRMGDMPRHYAMIGMAVVMEGMPLYYDGVNEHGLGMAGLNFPGNAVYHPEQPDRENVAPFEFIPWILGQCATVDEAWERLAQLNLVDIPFSPALPLSPLHWMISDQETSVVVESTADGLHVYDNPVGVLTNNPPFPYHLFRLNDCRGISAQTPPNRFSQGLEMEVYCQGLGGLGLPGDLSSVSRFIRAAFATANSVCELEEAAGVSQFFHLLGFVEMPRGSCRTDSGRWDITVYSSCVDTDTGRYYYTTYDNRRICCVDLHSADLEGSAVKEFPLEDKQDILYQN